MKLGQLDPQFVKYFSDETGDYLRHVPDLGQAEGIVFLCPACFVRNNGAVGTHALEVTFAGRGVPDEKGSRNSTGGPSRWAAAGSSYDDLTLDPSILINPAEPACSGWHGWIRNGEVA
jgi:hypothetical protein